VQRNLALQAPAQGTVHIAYLHGPVTLTTNSCYFPRRHSNGNAAYWLWV